MYNILYTTTLYIGFESYAELVCTRARFFWVFFFFFFFFFFLFVSNRKSFFMSETMTARGFSKPYGELARYIDGSCCKFWFGPSRCRKKAPRALGGLVG
jgi:hypothetical protein